MIIASLHHSVPQFGGMNTRSGTRRQGIRWDYLKSVSQIDACDSKAYDGRSMKTFLNPLHRPYRKREFAFLKEKANRKHTPAIFLQSDALIQTYEQYYAKSENLVVQPETSRQVL